MHGDRIKQLREERRLTRYALAKRAGLSHPYIKKLEEGLIGRPSYSMLQRVADALEVNLNQIVTEGDELSLFVESFSKLSPEDKELIGILMHRLASKSLVGE